MASKNFKESNAYTLIFAVVLVLVVGLILSGLNEALKGDIKANQKAEKKMNILSTIGVESTLDNSNDIYTDYIKNELIVNAKGEVVGKGEEAFKVNITKEIKVPVETQKFPLYEAEKDGKKYFIIPLRGVGLWGPIWGFISLDESLVVNGVTFDHQSETPGLGAKIKDDPSFYNDFAGEHILDKNKSFAGVNVLKGNEDPNNEDKMDNEVDAISGATITSVGVADMIQARLKLYMPYLSKNKK